MGSPKQKSNNFLAFLLGGLTGSVITFLLAPKSGSELRGEIINRIDFYESKAIEKRNEILNEAKARTEGILNDVEILIRKIKDFALNKYDVPIEKIEKEIQSLKAGVSAAINTYRHRSNNENLTDIFVDNMIDEKYKNKFINIDEEILPKHLSMRRRNN
ncbi:MAG: YtxH domain-containing protein [Ignavibacteriaceae bacterium]